MKLYIVRHGESETNRKGLWTGWLDVALTDKGIAVFSHGGWLTNALCLIFGVEIPRKNIYCGNCATLILEYTGDVWRMAGWINLLDTNAAP